MDIKVKNHTRGLQRIWIPEHSLWLHVWCHDDGELDRDKRLAFSVVNSPSNFWPPGGNFILACQNAEASVFTYVYGIPQRLELVSGVLKLWYTDLTGALGWPRQPYGDDHPDPSPGSGKDLDPISNLPYTGMYLEGTFSRPQLDGGPIIWTQKDLREVHNNPSPIIEVTDLGYVTNGTPYTGFAAPTGTLLAEYERDWAGRIKTYYDGTPKFMPIDPNRDTSAQNFKIGYLALNFVENLFGNGVHGWIGGNAQNVPIPWDMQIITESGAKKMIYTLPGTIAGFLPSNAFNKFPVDESTTYYCKAACTTDGKVITALQINVDTSPPIVQVPTMGILPNYFEWTVGMITAPLKIFNIAQRNLNAGSTVLFLTDKATPGGPGTLAYAQWVVWTLV